MITVYGIPNCDSVKKARTWLTEQGLDYTFHDYKKQGVPADLLTQWVSEHGWTVLLNRKGPTWRKLPPEMQATVVDNASAVAVMCAHSSTIKRPVIVWGSGAVSVGYDPDVLQRCAHG
ncbi:arsenate reductase [Curvibacter sp. CHRR-16]|uniref:arsenate reductase n=1 Tax=Curvibacter sp. CHRR-16 TaxID=2835872 RepID=UPI001BDAB95D|nr:arsenate reductase [Curvibacter sp. CHRR-16]MBT0571423.1 arsenate reductase [Curvibacter sp. CHRR-16]